MIKAPDAIKTAYKADDTKKSYFVVFRDSGIVLTNSEIVSESLSITESICSSGSFKIGLCEASVCSLEAILPKNLYKDEMCVFQCLGDFNATWDTDEIYGLYISGDDITNLYAGRNVDSESHLILGNTEGNFIANKNYLVLAKVKYIYNEILLYLENSNGLRRNIYYINPSIFNEKTAEEWDDSTTYNYGEIVIDNNSAWKSIVSNNTDRPSVNSAKWRDVSRYLQIALPLPGNEVSLYRCALYSKNTELIVAAKIYEFDSFVMPLGLYGVDRCQKKNSSKQYGITGYSRMRDMNLSENTIISYDLEGLTIGDVIDEAVKNTQIALGSNLSAEGTSSILISNTPATVSNWPDNPIYEGTKTKTIQGSYNRNKSGYHYTGPTVAYSIYDLYNYFPTSYWIRVTGDLFRPVIEGYTYNGIVEEYSDWSIVHFEFKYDSTPNYISTQSLMEHLPDGIYVYQYKNSNPSSKYGFSLSEKAFSFTESYDYGYDWNLSSVQGWKLISEIEISKGNCYRVYSLKYTWNARITAKSLQYQVENYLQTINKIYEVNYQKPLVYGLYPREEILYQSVLSTLGNALNVNKHSDILSAVESFSTSSNVDIDINGYFDIDYIDSYNVDLIIEGSTTTTSTVVNDFYDSPFIEVELHSKEELFNNFHIEFNKQNDLQTQRRNIISAYLEFNGMFVLFDRYGISQMKKVTAATLFPAEDLFPRDASINPAYSNIYPSESGELVNTSICKSLLVEDRLNEAFDGIEIIKSDSSASDASQYPFFYNRQSSEYGAVPAAVQETGYYEGQNYYVIKDNFFFDNFVFTNQELLEICRELIKRIGFLRYFNLNADLRALPYLEPGDAVLIMTAESGIETLILRRTMSGCIAMMDSIETDFYDE